MEEKPTLTEQQLRYLPYLVAVSFFMQMLDGTILNTALPSIARSFQCDALNLHSVVIAYMLTVAVLIPTSGWIADKLGTRRTFILSTIVFCAGSLCCAASMSVKMLTISRIIQGVGAAYLMPVGRLTILRSYPRDRFVQVMNLVTIPGLIGPLIGPLLGGFFSEHLSWHWIFLINIPIGVVGIWAAVKLMPNMFGASRSDFDVTGFILFAAGAVLITLGLDSEGTGAPKSLTLMLTLVSLGLALLVGYWYHARHYHSPIFNLNLFRNRTFTIGIAGNLISRLGGSSMPYLIPLFFQLVLGYSAFKSGLSLLPLACGSILIKFAIPPLLRMFGYKKILLINTLILGGLISCFSLVTTTSSHWMLLTLLAFLGMANSIQFTSMSTLTLIDLSDSDASSGNSLLSVVMQLSMSFGIGVSALLLEYYRPSGIYSEPMRLESTFHATFVFIGLFSILSGLIFMRLDRQKGKNTVTSRNAVAHMDEP